MILALTLSSITIVSNDATIWSITYDRHYDNRNSFIIQATGVCGIIMPVTPPNTSDSDSC